MVKLGILVPGKGCGENSVGRAASEESAHVTRVRVTLDISGGVSELRESWKKGRVGMWDGWSDWVNSRCAGTLCGGRVETGRAGKTLTRVGQ